MHTQLKEIQSKLDQEETTEDPLTEASVCVCVLTEASVCACVC